MNNSPTQSELPKSMPARRDLVSIASKGQRDQSETQVRVYQKQPNFERCLSRYICAYQKEKTKKRPALYIRATGR
jgi:hypothetical protein